MLVNYFTVANKSSVLLMNIKINSQRLQLRIFTTKSNIKRENGIFLIINERNTMHI